jgi:ribosomal-protein-serine acetyltransferase
VQRFFIDERTVLRPLLETDAGALFAAIDGNRARLRRFLPWLDATRSKQDIVTFRARVIAQEHEGVGLTRVIEQDRAICGVVAFNHIDMLNRKAVIGYWLDHAHEGRGLCRKSCALLINYAFLELGLNRMGIAAALENRRSRAVAERLGFTLEGVTREAEWLYDHYVDHARYGLLRREWQQVVGS